MPVITIWMVRFALVFLMLAFLSGSVILLNKAFGWSPAVWILLPMHIEMALAGWVLQMALGTAYWIFPRYLNAPKRGNVLYGWLMLIALNGGILLSVFSMGNAWLLICGRLLMIAAILTFIRLIWGRVVSYRNI